MTPRPFPLDVDVHVHVGALPDGQNGCYISEKILHGFLFRSFFKQMGLPINDAPKANALYLARLKELIMGSTRVSRAVILAMDGVYDSGGVLDQNKTEFIVSNDFVLRTAAASPELFLPGVSINPQRRDAITELDRCAEAGAVLLKALPNAQVFDPANPAYRAFWRRMAHHRIPLLSHVGYEFSLIGQDQSVGDPIRLRAPLDEGVTVIAAHGASFGLVFYEKYWRTLQRLVQDYSTLFWDSSALSLPNRVGMLLKLRHRPDLQERMVFGTDYPLPCFAYPALVTGSWSAYQALRTEENPFDRHARLLEMLGFPTSKKT